MRSVLIIASNTYREIIRDRILYGIVVLALLLIGLSLALGHLTFSEQARITADFGLLAIQLSAVVLSIFLGSSLVTKEIEKKTIMTLLVRPVTRLQFLLGKALGLLLVQVTVMVLIALVLVAIFKGIGMAIEPRLFLALHGVLLEAVVLMGLALFFSIFASPMMVVAFTLALFFIGHWLDSLAYFTKKAPGTLMAFIGEWLPKILPNLENFNFRSAVVSGTEIPASAVGWASVHSVAWFAALLILAVYIFGRRDFA